MEIQAPRLIKKYANRKLYDTHERHYVTLDAVAELVGSGHRIRVVDQVSGDDITDATLENIRPARRPTNPESAPFWRRSFPETVLIDVLRRGEQVMGLLGTLRGPRAVRLEEVDAMRRRIDELEDEVDRLKNQADAR